MTSIYRVRSRDSIAEVAQFHGTTVPQLYDLNRELDPDIPLFAGQVINVPDVDEPGEPIHLSLSSGDGPAWYRIAMREMETGVDELKGPEHNPRIIEYHAATSLRATDDETPWCSSFVNWCMMKAGVPRTENARARSWLHWGVSIDEPTLGCVVVFSRPATPTSGHVAFFKERLGERLLVLGGNQSDQVNLASYPMERLLGFRWSDD